MIKKIILAVVLVVLLFVAWRVSTMCKTGDGSGILSGMFATTCHRFYPKQSTTHSKLPELPIMHYLHH